MRRRHTQKPSYKKKIERSHHTVISIDTATRTLAHENRPAPIITSSLACVVCQHRCSSGTHGSTCCVVTPAVWIVQQWAARETSETSDVLPSSKHNEKHKMCGWSTGLNILHLSQ